MSRGRWPVSPDNVQPERFALLLERHGWRVVANRAGLYTRWAAPEGDEQAAETVTVPLSDEMADYQDLIRQALGTLNRSALAHSRAAESVLAGLVPPPGDEIKFRKETVTTQGAVAWPIGGDLVAAAQNTLLAAAKARVSKTAYYGTTSGEFAHRYLAAVLMGQTDIGSYIVTAYSPPDAIFHEKEPREDAPPIPGVGVYTGRDITRSLTTALQAARGALEDYALTSSLRPFEEAVRLGVSRELATALSSMATDADGAEITVEWSSTTDTLDASNETEQQSVSFEFSGGEAPVLSQAARHLSTLTPSEYVRATGWVKVVARPERGQAGVVSLKVLAGSSARTLKVRLTEDQFALAAAAITANQGLVVSGRQEKEGQTHWLYDATDLAVLDLPARTPGRRAEAHGQVEAEFASTEREPDLPNPWET